MKGLFAAIILLSVLFHGPALADDPVPPAVLASFEEFSKSWMSRLEAVNQDNSRALKPETVAESRVVGRYLYYGPDCAREVRGTGSKVTPYVGIIRYAQRVMEKEGETPQKMLGHPGMATSEIQVTEIFRYTDGRWVY